MCVCTCDHVCVSVSARARKYACAYGVFVYNAWVLLSQGESTAERIHFYLRAP